MKAFYIKIIKKYISYYVLLLLIIVFFYRLENPKPDSLSYILLAIITLVPAWIVLQPFRSSLIWLKRVIFYIFLWFTSIIISSTFLSYLGTFDSNINSAQYMISALIQSEAAIIAIVITLTLVVVQHTASTYSTRIIEIFKTRNPDFWILLIIYLFSMIYGLSVLKAVKEYDFDPIVNPSHLANLEGHIFYVYCLGVFAFIALIPYMWNTIDLMKPLKIMEFLSDKISNENLLKYVNSTNAEFLDFYAGIDYMKLEKKGVEDPFQPIVDIIISSLVKYDYYNANAGMKIMVEKIPLIYKNNSQIYQFESQIIQKVINHFEMIGHIAVYKTGGDILLNIIELLSKIGRITANEKRDYSTKRIVLSIEKIGKISAENKRENALTAAFLELRSLKVISEDREVNIEPDITNSINNITFEATKHGLQKCIKTGS